jgi:hypothetical protein
LKVTRRREGVLRAWLIGHDIEQQSAGDAIERGVFEGHHLFDTGVVDQDVDRPVGRLHGGHQAVALGGDQEVGRVRVRRGPDAGGGGGKLVATARHQHHPRSRSAEDGRDLGADTARAAGEEDEAPRQVMHRCPGGRPMAKN